jgi:hypothetical protein
MWFDLEWLGVGSVRCGFVIDGKFITCHTFFNGNLNNKAYMTTAILPLRQEIRATGTPQSTSVLKLICSSVLSEGGYDKLGIPLIARMNTQKTIGLTIIPLISIRLSPTRLDSIILPISFNFTPITTNSVVYEILLVKNGMITGENFTIHPTSQNVEVDINAHTIL